MKKKNIFISHFNSEICFFFLWIKKSKEILHAYLRNSQVPLVYDEKGHEVNKPGEAEMVWGRWSQL